jgi:hypothetical protein
MARWWGMNIKITGEWLREADDNYTAWMGRDAEQWEADVQGVLRKIEQSKTGKLLMEQIASVKTRKTVIVPIRAANFLQTAARPTDWTKAMKNKHQWDCKITDSCPPVPPRGPAIVPHSHLLEGTGKGGDVRLYYHPGSWTAADQTRAVDVAAGIDTLSDNFQPDDVLFHELVHAYRAMLGIFEAVPTGDTWDATEEFFAIVLSNIYVSETRPSGTMRGDHNIQFHSLKDAGQVEEDQAFYLVHISKMEQMIREMPDLTAGLMETDPKKQIGTWNPLRFSRRIEETRDMWSSGPAYLDLLSK